MIECWDDDADARLTASCVYERLSHLMKSPSLPHYNDENNDGVELNEVDIFNEHSRLIDDVKEDDCCIVELSNDLSIVKPPDYSSNEEYSSTAM